MSSLKEYRQAAEPLPQEYKAWQIFGSGFENVGKDGKPVSLPLREPKDNEVMLRVDALGLCQSDIKIISQGSKHARLRGRDLAKEPTVLGHECAATVVKVGKDWQGKFKPGERFIVQADIYYKGIGYAFGYLIPGGLGQYCYLDERALDGDEGCYLLPVRPETGYSQAALSEPWACVEMSYNLIERMEPGDGAVLVVTDIDADQWRVELPIATVVSRSLDGLPEGEFDDIILPMPSADIVNALAPRLRKKGIMYLLGMPCSDSTVSLDIGRIHYEDVRYYGGGNDLASVRQSNARHDLLPGGSALFMGAGGPMGQMHVQRAVEIPNGPELVVVTDLDRARLDHIERRFGDIATHRGVKLITFAPGQFESQDAMNAHIKSLAHGGFDDVIVMAPVAKLVPQAMSFAADNAVVNVFAGVGIGSMADIALRDLCRGIKIIGSSGSRISDLRKVLEMVERSELNTNLSIAAIGGLSAAREGLEGVNTARFPGKTVIYPQIPDLPLMPVEEVEERVPELKGKLGPHSAWTKEAEQALLEKYV
ncbi:MAG TPA: alcohol dehydrogenase catalytic domain-containing protein [Candidatus Hydrogenedentes bacterium]|nr:alcohol dehydrogenase catalytic domain-containing protein [Candidatus Hydrogenedentota bacterium]HRK34471.1 alcohol dehydrogenase catalytic domain-containing protein [Candidatus Hydrogenedentota bacterium]